MPIFIRRSRIPAPAEEVFAWHARPGAFERLFTYRHTVTRQDMVAHAASRERVDRWLRKENTFPAGARGGLPMHIAVTGSSGLLGSALVSFLAGGGHRLTRLVRSPATAGAAEIEWHPQAGRLEPNSLEGLDGFVHLAGENIAGGRWTARQKARIRDSRINSTRLLSETLATLSRPPKVLVCASAVGFYGDRGADLMSEDSPAGSGFLAEVCAAWEAASQPARDAGIRTVLLRIGVVLSPAGGALARMLLPFRLGAGGVIGSGDQYWSWIGLDDVIGAIHHALIHDGLEGAVNAVAPQPVTNRVFTTTLGTVLGRPTFVPLPGFAARLALGEMADALLLASTRVEPARLLASGYSFRQPELEGALRHCLGKHG